MLSLIILLLKLFQHWLSGALSARPLWYNPILWAFSYFGSTHDGLAHLVFSSPHPRISHFSKSSGSFYWGTMFKSQGQGARWTLLSTLLLSIYLGLGVLLSVYIFMAWLNSHPSPRTGWLNYTPFFLPWNLISCNKTLSSTQVVGWSSLHSIFPVTYIVFPDLPMLSLLPVKPFLPLSLHSALSFQKGQTHTSVHTPTHACSHTHIGTHYLSSWLNPCPQINLQRLGA